MAPTTLKSRTPKSARNGKGFPKFMLMLSPAALFPRFFKYAATTHVRVKMFIAGSRSGSENGL